MSQPNHIELLKAKLLEKLHAGDPLTWSNQQYEGVCEDILTQTKIKISVNTLKRFLGKLKTEANYTPQTASLDAISKYLGYKNFYAFKKEISEIPMPEKEIVLSHPRDTAAHKGTEGRAKRYKLALLFVAALLAGCVGYAYWLNVQVEISNQRYAESKLEKVRLEAYPSDLDSAPAKSRVVYEVPNHLYTHKGALLMINGRYYPLSKGRNVKRHSFKKPGIYSTRVLMRDSIYATQYIGVHTHGWDAQNGKFRRVIAATPFLPGALSRGKVKGIVVDEFLIPASNFQFRMQFDTLNPDPKLKDDVKMQIKFVFDHNDVDIVIYGKSIKRKVPHNKIGDNILHPFGLTNTLSGETSANINIKSDGDGLSLVFNDKKMAHYPFGGQDFGNLKAIRISLQRVAKKPQVFNVRTLRGNISYDLLEVE